MIIGPVYQIGWILYSLEWLKKPVDAFAFRNVQHPPVEAHDRYVQQELTVDWFDFWLNGAESDDPRKAEQYKRWRDLRKKKDALPPATKSTVPLSKMDCAAP